MLNIIVQHIRSTELTPGDTNKKTAGWAGGGAKDAFIFLKVTWMNRIRNKGCIYDVAHNWLDNLDFNYSGMLWFTC